MDNGLEEMAYIAAHEDVAKKYNESGKAKKQPSQKSAPNQPAKQELDGVEDMAYIAANHIDSDKKKSKPAVREYIASLINKNKDKDSPTR